jgi:6-phosphogluconate dehydrogenase
MSANQSVIGLIGPAVLGENLVLNMESRRLPSLVHNRTAGVTDKFADGKANGEKIQPTRTMESKLSQKPAQPKEQSHRAR